MAVWAMLSYENDAERLLWVLKTISLIDINHKYNLQHNKI